jgi:hypothetical protein
MPGKLLVVITSGPDEVNKVSWGLRMALNVHTHPYGEKLVDEVKVIAIPLGLEDDSQSLGVECVHASVYVAQCVSEGFTIMTF